MTTVHRGSDIENPSSVILRSTLIVAVAVVVLCAGHYGIGRLLGRGATASAPGQIRFGPEGRDAADVPAPPRSERAFAMAAPQGTDRALVRYASQASPADVVAYYRRMLPGRGWTERPAGREVQTGYPGTVLCYSNAAGNSCIIAVSQAAPGETDVTVLRMAR